MTDEEFGKELVAHIKLVRYVCNKYTRNRAVADDVVQDVLAKAWAARDKYDEKYKFSYWLGALARNTYVDKYRSDKLKSNIRKTVELELVAEPSEALDLDIKYTADIVINYVRTLRYGDMMLKIAGGMKYKEAAEYFDIPVGTIKANMNRLRVHINERFGSVLY